jgi:hypothetical protein
MYHEQRLVKKLSITSTTCRDAMDVNEEFEEGELGALTEHEMIGLRNMVQSKT